MCCCSLFSHTIPHASVSDYHLTLPPKRTIKNKLAHDTIIKKTNKDKKIDVRVYKGGMGRMEYVIGNQVIKHRFFFFKAKTANRDSCLSLGLGVVYRRQPPPIPKGLPTKFNHFAPPFSPNSQAINDGL